MEGNEILDHGMHAAANTGGLTSEDKDYLDTAAKWAKFLGIVGFVFTGLGALVSLFLLTAGGALMGVASPIPGAVSYLFLLRCSIWV